jgi:tetratricopeptide (TPR) repeat protein
MPGPGAGYTEPRRRLIGRDVEVRRLDALLDEVRAGASRALVMHGDPGIGKTALLVHVGVQAAGLRVLRASGAEAEMELPFAGLQLLCSSMLNQIDRLQEPQRDALKTAFGLSEGRAPDRFLVGLAALSLLSEVAQEGPVICLIDDAQWLDHASAQALAFVARRLVAESVGLVFATRSRNDLDGLPELAVERLRSRDARALLHSALSVPLDEQVRDRIVAEARGSPLALLEFPRGISPAELAGGFGLPDVQPVTERITGIFLRRIAPLSVDSRLLVLAAAADPTGDAVLLWRAAEQLGIEPDAALAVERTGLTEFDMQVRFRHPLARSAVYGAASPEERRIVHRALANATNPATDPDRRAWHLAQATDGLDEDVAAELERSAARAQSRGGVAAAAALLEKSAALTPSRARRAARALAAARAKYQSGALDDARRLLAAAQAGLTDDLLLAQAGLLEGQLALASGDGADAPKLLLSAAERLKKLDAGLARETYLDALTAAMAVGASAGTVGLPEVAAAARIAPDAPQTPSAPDLLLDGLATLLTEGSEAAAPTLRRALSAFPSEDLTTEARIRWSFVACRMAHDVWDDESWDELSARQLQLARDIGALTPLPLAVRQRIGVLLHRGEFAAAGLLAEELEVTNAVTESNLPAYGALAVAGWRGEVDKARRLSDTILEQAKSRGDGMGLSHAHYSNAVLFNGLGRYQDALAAAEQACAQPRKLGLGGAALAELVEAAAHVGETARAMHALDDITRSTGHSESNWAVGIEARSRALLSDGDDAELLYQRAIDRLVRSRAVVALGAGSPHLRRMASPTASACRRPRRVTDRIPDVRVDRCRSVRTPCPA